MDRGPIRRLTASALPLGRIDRIWTKLGSGKPTTSISKLDIPMDRDRHASNLVPSHSILCPTDQHGLARIPGIFAFLASTRSSAYASSTGTASFTISGCSVTAADAATDLTQTTLLAAELAPAFRLSAWLVVVPIKPPSPPNAMITNSLSRVGSRRITSLMS